jgi:acyl-CoA thioester hydrolase
MTDSCKDAIYRWVITVPDDALDQNGHVNNVQYLSWMQDVAVRHYESLGALPLTESIGATWWVRSHHIEYLAPAFEGDEIEIRTWIANLRRVRSLRRYEFVRVSDGTVLVRGETDWVFVDAESGRPRAIPDTISRVLPNLEKPYPKN